eukprot:gnl/Dysnectes_brevis/2148_a2498_767.p1 GENE.gnl/Dysnectes_brevis/2148_a2498_767~~gnl/Dysnectes_brevis/2148_a2498_767.p1  ORF type:complete len:1677 (+),score=348.77 gnl/Dysnectes_brevis/2148_a2498_767:56-5032(+)
MISDDLQLLSHDFRGLTFRPVGNIASSGLDLVPSQLLPILKIESRLETRDIDICDYPQYGAPTSLVHSQLLSSTFVVFKCIQSLKSTCSLPPLPFSYGEFVRRVTVFLNLLVKSFTKVFDTHDVFKRFMKNLDHIDPVAITLKNILTRFKEQSGAIKQQIRSAPFDAVIIISHIMLHSFFHNTGVNQFDAMLCKEITKSLKDVTFQIDLSSPEYDMSSPVSPFVQYGETVLDQIYSLEGFTKAFMMGHLPCRETLRGILMSRTLGVPIIVLPQDLAVLKPWTQVEAWMLKEPYDATSHDHLVVELDFQWPFDRFMGGLVSLLQDIPSGIAVINFSPEHKRNSDLFRLFLQNYYTPQRTMRGDVITVADREIKIRASLRDMCIYFGLGEGVTTECREFQYYVNDRFANLSSYHSCPFSLDSSIAQHLHSEGLFSGSNLLVEDNLPQMIRIVTDVDMQGLRNRASYARSQRIALLTNSAGMMKTSLDSGNSPSVDLLGHIDQQLDALVQIDTKLKDMDIELQQAKSITSFLRPPMVLLIGLFQIIARLSLLHPQLASILTENDLSEVIQNCESVGLESDRISSIQKCPQSTTLTYMQLSEAMLSLLFRKAAELLPDRWQEPLMYTLGIFSHVMMSYTLTENERLDLLTSIRVCLNEDKNAIAKLLSSSGAHLDKGCSEAIELIDLMPPLFKSSPQLVNSWKAMCHIGALSPTLRRWVKFYANDRHSFVEASLHDGSPFTLVLENLKHLGLEFTHSEHEIKAVEHSLPEELNQADIGGLVGSLPLVLALKPVEAMKTLHHFSCVSLTRLRKTISDLRLQRRYRYSSQSTDRDVSPVGVRSPVQTEFIDLFDRMGCCIDSISTGDVPARPKVGMLFYEAGVSLQTHILPLFADHPSFRDLPPPHFCAHRLTPQAMQHAIPVVDITMQPLLRLHEIVKVLRVHTPPHGLVITMRVHGRGLQSMVDYRLVDALSVLFSFGAHSGIVQPIDTIAMGLAHCTGLVGRKLFELTSKETNPVTPQSRIRTLFPIASLRDMCSNTSPFTHISLNDVFNEKAFRLFTSLAIRQSLFLGSSVSMPFDVQAMFYKNHALKMMVYASNTSTALDKTVYADHYLQWPSIVTDASNFVPFNQTKDTTAETSERMYVGPPFSNLAVDPPFIVSLSTLIQLDSAVVSRASRAIFSGVNQGMYIAVPHKENISFTFPSVVSRNIDRAVDKQQKLHQRAMSHRSDFSEQTSELSVGMTDSSGPGTIISEYSPMSARSADYSLSGHDTEGSYMSDASDRPSKGGSEGEDSLTDLPFSDDRLADSTDAGLSLGNSLDTDIDRILNEGELTGGVQGHDRGRKNQIVEVVPSSRLLSALYFPAHCTSFAHLVALYRRLDAFCYPKTRDEMEEGDDLQFYTPRSFSFTAIFRVLLTHFLSTSTENFMFKREHVVNCFDLSRPLLAEKRIPREVHSLLLSGACYAESTHWYRNFIESGDQLLARVSPHAIHIGKAAWTVDARVYRSSLGLLVFYLRTLNAVRLGKALNDITTVLRFSPPRGAIVISDKGVKEDKGSPLLFLCVTGMHLSGLDYDFLEGSLVDSSQESRMGYRNHRTLFICPAVDRRRNRSVNPLAASGDGYPLFPLELDLGGAEGVVQLHLQSKAGLPAEVWGLKNPGFVEDLDV